MPHTDPTVRCPMPGCDEWLILRFTSAYTFVDDDLTDDDPAAYSAAIGHSFGWSVECIAGHVVLLPTSDDEANEDTERFKPSDNYRLRDVIRRLRLAEVAS